MADASFPHPILAGNQRSPVQLQANFEALRDYLNSADWVDDTRLAAGAALANLLSATVTDAKLASPNNAAYKTILEASAVEKTAGAFGAGTYSLGTGIALDDSSPTDLLLAGVGPAAVKYFVAADYAVAGLTTKLRVRAQVSSNATASAITFTYGLYPVTFSGGAGVLNVTLGTVVAGTTVAIASPAASTVVSGVSTDATIPADGLYCLGVATSGSPASNHAALLSAELQVRNV